jgi:hypothetical protein
MADQAMTCEQAALFLHNVGGGWLFMMFFVLALLSTGPTMGLMGLANPKLADPIQTVPLPSHSASSSFSTPTEAPATPPPSYEEQEQENTPGNNTSNSENHPSTYSDVQWALRRDAAETTTDEDDAFQFVNGTILLAFLVTSFVILALTIQGMTYCVGWDGGMRIALWVLYGGLCLFGLRGLGAWIVLLRNLWGKRGKERLVIKDDFIIRALGFLLILPYVTAVECVIRCQRYFCGGGDVEDVELGITPSSARFPTEAREDAGEDAGKAAQARAEREGLLAEAQEGSGSAS